MAPLRVSLITWRKSFQGPVNIQHHLIIVSVAMEYLQIWNIDYHIHPKHIYPKYSNTFNFLPDIATY